MSKSAPTTKGRGRPITKGSTVLKLVRDSIANGRWCQGEYAKKNGAACLVGHFDRVVLSHSPQITSEASYSAMGAELADIDAEGHGDGRVNFNDEPGRKKSEVIEHLDRSIKIAKKAERKTVSA